MALRNCTFAALLLVTSASANASTFWMEGIYGGSSVRTQNLNAFRQSHLWNDSTASAGELKNPSYAAFAIGHRFVAHTMLSVRYERQSAEALSTEVAGANYTVRDSFSYEPLYLMIDLPLRLNHLLLTIGGGVGYALNYQFHQVQRGGTGEDVLWQSHPLGWRARMTAGFKLFSFIGVFAELQYEQIRSPLKAYKDYQTTVNGSSINQGQELTDGQGDRVIADLSGLRYGFGIRLHF